MHSVLKLLFVGLFDVFFGDSLGNLRNSLFLDAKPLSSSMELALQEQKCLTE